MCVLGEEAGGFLTVALGLLLAEKGESSLVNSSGTTKAFWSLILRLFRVILRDG